MRSIDQQFPVYTDDLDQDLALVIGDEVRHILDQLGVDFDAGALLVGTHDGEYTEVWGTETTVPRDSTRWYDLLD